MINGLKGTWKEVAVAEFVVLSRHWSDRCEEDCEHHKARLSKMQPGFKLDISRLQVRSVRSWATFLGSDPIKLLWLLIKPSCWTHHETAIRLSLCRHRTRGTNFAFRFFAVYVERQLKFSRRLLLIVTTCFGLTGHQVYILLWWRTLLLTVMLFSFSYTVASDYFWLCGLSRCTCLPYL
jgi:hypothetical protein